MHPFEYVVPSQPQTGRTVMQAPGALVASDRQSKGQ